MIRPGASFPLMRTTVIGTALGMLLGCSGEAPVVRTDRIEPELSTGDYRQTQTGRAGGTIRVSAAADTGTLDLHSIAHTNAQWLGRLIFDNLVYLDDQGRPSPWLAKSWTISPDGRTYTFHLREGVTFSDGAAFDAEAVRLNLEHMRDPATKSPLAAAYIAPYVSGRVLDRYTFEATLREPYAPFLNVLAQSWLALMSPKAIKENPKGLASNPIGSGPFVVTSYRRQQGITLVRRPDYDWAPDFIGHRGPAFADGVEINFIPESLIRYASLASDQYDLTIDAPPQNAAAIRSNPELLLDNRVRTGIASRAISFNVEQAPFNELKIRQALAFATGRDGIAHSNGFGLFRAKADFLASNTQDYDAAAGTFLLQDLTRANRLLDEAGWIRRDADSIRTRGSKRLTAEVLTTENASLSPVLVAFQSDVRAIGFDLRIVQLTTPILTQRRIGGDYQALSSGVWHTNTPDALYINYSGSEVASKKRIGQNVSRLRDAEFDRLVEQARVTTDPAAREQAYALAQQRLVWLAPAVPVYENHTITARRRTLNGVLFDTSHNTPVLTAAWLDRQS